MKYVVNAHRRGYDNETLYTDDRVLGTASPALFADFEDDTFGLVTPLQGHDASVMVHRHANNEPRVLVKPELDLNGCQTRVAVGH